jgi:hypothetical protein
MNSLFRVCQQTGEERGRGRWARGRGGEGEVATEELSPPEHIIIITFRSCIAVWR